MRCAQDEQVIPLMSSWTWLVMSRRELVARLLDCAPDVVLGERLLAGHPHRPALEHDVDGGHAGEVLHLLGHRGDAVSAGHAGHGPGLRGRHERTNLLMASLASLSLTSASGPPSFTASATQCAMCSSRSPRATDCRAL